MRVCWRRGKKEGEARLLDMLRALRGEACGRSRGANRGRARRKENMVAIELVRDGECTKSI